MKKYYGGIDVGSTTVKLVITDESRNIIFGEYRRHYADIQATLASLIEDAKKQLGNLNVSLRITGSGSINLGKSLGIEFIQEVVAVATAVKQIAPQTDVAIELGGEDAKIIYFKGGLEERMNGVCAGGTGSFIDQMAALLQTDASGLNELAKKYTQLYPIAARCGVFAKTDIQPLINEGAKKSDLAASIFQAVVKQTISGLACGKPIRGKVAFLGGPLHFLTELKKAFIRTLNLGPDDIIDPEHSHLLAAYGSSLAATEENAITFNEILTQLNNKIKMKFEIKRLDPLFNNEEEYNEFCNRHNNAVVKKGYISSYKGNCYLGIDAGSTTTKLALIGEDGELLYSFYANNQGSPIQTTIEAIKKLAELIPDTAKIAYSCSTGYGEQLLKAAFNLDEGEVETIAHCTAASFFDKDVDCVLDIGGQDMKCIKLNNGFVDSIMLNEACSSGCGSFIENFANSLGYTAKEFAQEAIYAKNPIDLGSRCTVFMNSNVKQAQKEGALVNDISAGLAYSVIKNALYKVIKLTDVAKLGKHIVVQGGTFYNKAVLRALEKITGLNVICPDISGIMGAFGAALIARERHENKQTTMLSLKDIIDFKYTTSSVRCGKCQNNCLLTINKFVDNRRYISGNRCERALGGEATKHECPNLVAYKRNRIFDYEPLDKSKAKRGILGIPRVLNMYENYPFWATFFKELGFSIVISPESSHSIYELGMESIPSESECYPAKLSHGHVEWLIKNGVKTIFHPSVFYERKETKDAQNQYNCPIVVAYPENLKNNIEAITDGHINYIRPFISLKDEETATDRLIRLCKNTWNIPSNEVKKAVKIAWQEQLKAKEDIRKEGQKAIDWINNNCKTGIVLAGRPYHIDPEINHGIPEMINSYGLAVLTEDSLPIDFNPTRPVRVNDQWVFHSRLYTAAEYIKDKDNLEMIQLNSFGCGLDAVTTDQVCEILEKNNKLYTVLKIDEVNNLGAARIRLRSLLSAINMRNKQNVKPIPVDIKYQRAEFTEEMFNEGYTILAPQMSPIHFNILGPVFSSYGFNIEILDNDNRKAIDTGLKFVNNDACYPSITTVGQIMDAVLSGKYDTNKLAIIMTQTGGCCRASNYVSFIRRALDQVNLSHIPVISLNMNGMEKNSGFKLKVGLILKLGKGVTYGDLLMCCLYKVRPYELVPGSANELHKKLTEICLDSLINKNTKYSYKQVCQMIVDEFDKLSINENLVKPRVGIVGEILVKYMPLANNHLVELLESEGAEVVVPDLFDFLNYTTYNLVYRRKYLGGTFISLVGAKAFMKVVKMIRKPAFKALNNSKRFESPVSIEEIAELSKPFISIGNQYGEGWFLTGEMVELIKSGVPNIVCVQPFACLPNHVVGKGAIKVIRKAYPDANIAAIDYDPGASEVNQLNRIKLMLTTAKEKLNK